MPSYYDAIDRGLHYAVLVSPLRAVEPLIGPRSAQISEKAVRTKLTDVREEDDSGNLLRRAATLTNLQRNCGRQIVRATAV